MAITFYDIEDLALKTIAGKHYFTIKFHQSVPRERYYRLRCNPYGSPDVNHYFYLEPFDTSAEWIYTQSFRILNGQNSTDDFDFASYFSSRPDKTTVKYVAYLQSSPSKTSSYWTESSASRILDITLDNSYNVFSPWWSTFPDWRDTRSTANTRKITTYDTGGLQGFSLMKLIPSPAQGQYGATIDKYSIVIPGAFSRNYTVLPSYIELDLSTYKSISRDLQIEFSAEDSRGFVRTIKRTLKIYSYLPPAFTADNIHRQNGTGKTLILDFEGSWYGDPPLNDGANPLLTCNSIEAKEEGSSSVFSTFVPELEISGNRFSFDGTWVDQNDDPVEFDSNKSYTLTFNITDGIKNVQLTHSVAVGTPVIAIRKQKVGINFNDPVYTLDVVGTIGQNGFPVMGYIRDIADTTVNLNNYKDTGIYVYSAGQGSIISNFPNGNLNTNLIMQVTAAKRLANGNYYLFGVQKAWYSTTGDEFVRTFDSSTFTTWKKVTMA